jgi:citrate synthase
MSNADTEVIRPGLEGVVAFETEIAEPDREGGSLRYRGVDIEELVGRVPFEKVWGLLVDESLEPGLPASHCELPVRTGGYMSDLQAALAVFSGEWGLKQQIDIDVQQARDDLARLSAAVLSVVAQSARGDEAPVPEDEVMKGKTAAERFLLAWRGEVDERHAKAIDTYWICTAEHGLNASTFTARIVASTAADCGAILASAVGALSGPLHGGAPARVLPMLDAVAELGDAEKWVRDALARGERIMGFGHRVYRAEDPRSRVLKRTAKELGSPRIEVAEELERVAHEAIAERHPGHSYTNVEFWSSVVLDVAEVPPPLAPAMFACSRTAGWSAHVLEQKRTGRLIRPSAKYVGPGERSLSSLDGR